MYKLDVLCLIPKWYITKWKSAAASVEGLCVARPGFLEFLYVLQYDVVQGAVAVAYLAHHQPHAQILLLVQLLHGLAVVFNVRILSHLSKRDRLFRVLIRNGNPLNRDFWLSKDTAKDSTELATTFVPITKNSPVYSRRYMKCWLSSHQNYFFMYNCQHIDMFILFSFY